MNQNRKRKGVAFGTLAKALLCYRAMAFITGTVLLLGCAGLAYEALNDTAEDSGVLSAIWIAHGYLFMAYVLVTLNLAVHLKWRPMRAVMVMAAGTIPTMSFFAERSVVRRVRDHSPVTQV